MAVTKIKPIKSTLKKALEYIQNPDKTDDKMLVSSFGCSYETADIEFAFTLSQALDNDERSQSRKYRLYEERYKARREQKKQEKLKVLKRAGIPVCEMQNILIK